MTQETTSALIQLETLNAVEVFTGERLDDVLRRIRDEVSGFVADLSTDKGRKEVASMAHKVSKAKVALDGLGKDLVSDWKSKASKVDESRRKSRQFLDELRDEVRKPLTDWEQEQLRIAREENERIERERVAEAERVEAERIEKERQLIEREAEVARKEQEIKDKANAEAAERQRVIDEEQQRVLAETNRIQLQRDADAAAKRDADEKIRKARAAARERIEKADRDAQKRIDDAAAEQKRVETERLAEIERKRVAEEARQADEDHRRTINREALNSFMEALGATEEHAMEIVSVIASGKIARVTIKY